jgi:hypothetical protein
MLCLIFIFLPLLLRFGISFFGLPIYLHGTKKNIMLHRDYFLYLSKEPKVWHCSGAVQGLFCW